MNIEIYNSIVSNLATVAPLFAKTMVDLAIEKAGHTVESEQ